MDTMTVHLGNAITVGGKAVTELSMRRSTVGDQEDALQTAIRLKRAQNALTIDLALFSILCRVPYDVLRGLQDSDLAALRKAYDELNSSRAPADDSDPTTGTPASVSES